MTKNYIFDLFGTLITDPDWEGMIARIFPDLDYNKIRSAIVSTDHTDRKTMVKAIFDAYHLDDYEKRLPKIMNKFDRYIADIQLMDGAIETLDALKERNKTLGMITNDSNAHKGALEKFGLRKYFDVIIQSHKVGYEKPQEQIYSLCLKMMSARPENTIMIGDKLEKDVFGPEKLGIKGILYDRENKSDYKDKITNLQELLLF